MSEVVELCVLFPRTMENILLIFIRFLSNEYLITFSHLLMFYSCKVKYILIF